MPERSYRVSLVSAGVMDEEGIQSLRISFRQYIRKLFNLKKNYLLRIEVIGIYEDKNATKYNPVPDNFPDFLGQVSVISGTKTMGMTIDKDEVRRQKLTSKQELEVKIEVTQRANE